MNKERTSNQVLEEIIKFAAGLECETTELSIEEVREELLENGIDPIKSLTRLQNLLQQQKNKEKVEKFKSTLTTKDVALINSADTQIMRQELLKFALNDAQLAARNFNELTEEDIQELYIQMIALKRMTGEL